MSGIIGSIFLSMPLLLGPVAGVLTDIYDCRYIFKYDSYGSYIDLLVVLFLS